MTESARFLDPECAAPDGTVALSTRELASSEGRAIWAETLDSTYCEMAVDWPSAQTSFAADIRARSLGDIAVSVVRADPHTVVRTPAMIESDPGTDYLLCLISRGSATITQDSRTGVLERGAFGLVDSSRPFVVSGVTEFEQIVLRVPRELFAARVGVTIADAVMAQTISAEGGVGRLASNILVDIATHDDGLEDASLGAVSSAVLDVVSAAVNHQASGLSVTDRLHVDDLLRVQSVMSRDMSDPDRSLADVGAELGMSVRYIHKLFSSAGTTPRVWLYAKRIDRAKRLLRQTDLSAAEIGAQLGFRDASHFSRTFSRHCGRSPSQFRADAST
ncbi:AraC-like ligand-binding domain-containing protein [Gordonia sputi]|uniref:Putative AraC family transcriptional regulator n=1 Tax=Gordonia sputi NBRC 100414 TaxID=1089453 RepID=H5U3H1_9ACTN|nr:helix-turn-helix domain-containing protein [Gordonia sputi]NKY95931.1 helix-turn-helix domain-containing protein [Gordonia sputi]GAB40279.1 putative AraC family transcriptional regulator [Gordonia sputi NBRC 100414]